MIEMTSVISEKQFKEKLNYFIDSSNEDERLELYKEYANENNCSTEEAKNSILKSLFSNYINESLRKALFLAESNDYDAFKIITKLEDLKPIFKDYDINSFCSFISSVKDGMSETNAELLFNNHYISDEFIGSLTQNLIKSIANPISRPKNIKEYIQAFNSHPLLYCLQEKNETDKVLDHIEEGVLDVGQYKQLIQLVLEARGKINDEKIDFFIGYLINEDISKGLYEVYKNEYYSPYALRNLLVKISQGENVNAWEVEYAIDKVSEKKQTLKTNAAGDILYQNSSSGTLNDSGFKLSIGEQDYFVHLHSAQGKGENQNAQQATTTNVLKQNNINSLGITLVKKNAGKADHWKDFCSDYGIQLNEPEKILLSNLQFEVDYLQFLVGTGKNENLEETHYLSQNFRIIKDSVESSVSYNKAHLGLSDAEIIRNKAQLYVSFLEKHFDSLQKLIENTDSEMSTPAQVAAVPLVKSYEYLLQLENRLGPLFNDRQINTINKFASEGKNSNSNSINYSKTLISAFVQIPRNRNVNVNEFNKYNDILTAPIEVKKNENEYSTNSVNVVEKQMGDNGKREEEIKNLLYTRHNGKGLEETLKILDSRNFYFSEGNYSNTNSTSYFFANRLSRKNTQGNDKTDYTYARHIEALNLICEYARIKGRSVFSTSQAKDYTNGISLKP